MPLLKALMKQEIEQIFKAQLDDIGQIASGIANAYLNYAMPALGAVGEPIILTGNEHKLLENALKQIFKNRIDINPASQLVGNAVLSFWLAPPVNTALGGKAVICLPMPGVAKMSSVKANSTSDAADGFTEALDIMTKTVMVGGYPPLIFPGTAPLK